MTITSLDARLPSIVVLGFKQDPEGKLVPAFAPKPMPDDLHAKVIAFDLRKRHVGVIALKRIFDPVAGERTEILAVYGDVPDDAPLHFRNL